METLHKFINDMISKGGTFDGHNDTREKTRTI